MMDEQLRELIRLRMQQATETLHEAQILIAEHAGHRSNSTRIKTVC